VTATTNVAATALSPATVCDGLTNQFCTTASGTGPFTYAWTKNGNPIAGATSSCYTATAGAGGAVDNYCVTVSGACGTPVQRCANLTANTNTATTAPDAQSGCAGDSVTVSTVTSGTGPFTWQWSKNGTSVPGATNSSFTFMLMAGDTQVCVTATGNCNSDTKCATLTVNDCNGTFCSLTQGAYGNSNGRFNGIRRTELITYLLTQHGPMTVGVSGVRSLTFAANAHDAQCIIDRLPAGGGDISLPDFGDETLDNDCQTSPTPIVLQNGKFRNNLLGQTITLSLNVRLNAGFVGIGTCQGPGASPPFSDVEVCHTMVTQRVLPGPDGCYGTADDVPDLNGPDGDPTTPDNIRSRTISSNVLTALDNLGLPRTVGGVLALANRALANLSTAPAGISEVKGAADSLNNLFDECMMLLMCQNP
jgi:hypothetical protein